LIKFYQKRWSGTGFLVWNSYFMITSAMCVFNLQHMAI
jgi:hypothetical protein